MNRIESGKMHLQIVPCSLAAMMHDLVDMVQSQIQAKQLDFFVDTMKVRDEAILTDPMKFNQIFLNLIGNAIKFNKAGGFVSVRITQSESAQPGYADYVFTVKDNGIGIAPEFTDHIFEAFEREDSTRTEKVEGTGLGLAIVKNIVDMLNGSISVSSELNKGSEFTVKLSFKIQEKQETAFNMEKLKGMRALVADDDFHTCDSVSAVLRDIGMEAEWTLTGREAVLKAKQAYELGKGYSAFIIDWLMPDMNGIEVTRRIRSVIGTETPIFILTAYDWSDIEQEAKEAGVTAFCRKPLFMSDIRHALLKTTGMLADEPQDRNQSALGVARLKDIYILVADDHPINLQIMVRLLKDKGMHVDTAEDGEMAVMKFSQSPDSYYDMILMDIRMPKMDGLQATEKIRALERRDAKEIPIVAMTANAFDEDVQKSLQAGMNAHLAKPVEPKALFETIAMLLCGSDKGNMGL